MLNCVCLTMLYKVLFTSFKNIYLHRFSQKVLGVNAYLESNPLSVSDLKHSSHMSCQVSSHRINSVFLLYQASSVNDGK